MPGAEGTRGFLLRKHAATLTTTTETPGTVRDGVSLRSQLAPLNVGELRRRLELLGAPSSPEREREVRASGGNGALRAVAFCARGGAPRAARFQGTSAARGRARASRFERAPSRTRRPRRGLSPMPSPSASGSRAPRSGARLGPRRRRRGRVHLALVARGRVALLEAAAAERQVPARRGDAAAAERAGARRRDEDAASLVDGLAVTPNVRGSPHATRGRRRAASPAWARFLQRRKKRRRALRGTGGFLAVEASPRGSCAWTRATRSPPSTGGSCTGSTAAYEGERFSLVWYRRTGDPRAAEPPARAVHERWWDARAAARPGGGGDAASWTEDRRRRAPRARRRTTRRRARWRLKKKYGGSTFTAEGVSATEE